MTCCPQRSWPQLSRRSLMGAIALGGGVTLMSGLAPGVARASGHAEALLLTCMDYRLVNEVESQTTT